MKSFMQKFQANAASEVRSTGSTHTGLTMSPAGEMHDSSGTPGACLAAVHSLCVNKRLMSYYCRVELILREDNNNDNDSDDGLDFIYASGTSSQQPDSTTDLFTENLLQESLLEDNIDPRNELEEILDKFLDKHSDFDAVLGSWELVVDFRKAGPALNPLFAHSFECADRTMVTILTLPKSTTYSLSSPDQCHVRSCCDVAVLLVHVPQAKWLWFNVSLIKSLNALMVYLRPPLRRQNARFHAMHRLNLPA